MEYPEKKIIPIVFAFDQNFVITAGVCITSLLYNAGKTDCYRVICLIDADVTEKDKKEFERLFARYPGHELVFMSMGNAFSEAQTLRHITKSTYYRLLIPRLLPAYKKVIYSDVDIIFQGSLSGLYFDEDITGMYLGAVKDSHVNLRTNHPAEIGCLPQSYFNAGFLVLNIEQINKDELVDVFLHLGKTAYLYMDQDMLNVACKGRVKFLSPAYNGQNMEGYTKDQTLSLWTASELSGLGQIVRHYISDKPWNTYRNHYQLWWYYYWRLPFRNKRLCLHVANYCKLMSLDCRIRLSRLIKKLISIKTIIQS